MRRMVIDINDATASDLAELEAMQEFNATTLFNRGLQIYAELERLRRAGVILMLNRPDGTMQELRWE